MTNDPQAPSLVLDTNVVLDWLVFRDPRVQALAAAIEAGRWRWLASTRMREEFGLVVVRASLARWAPDCGQALAAFDRLSLRREPAPACGLHCSDPDDQPFIDLALAEGCAWLVTHDRALLKLAPAAHRRALRVGKPVDWSTAVDQPDP